MLATEEQQRIVRAAIATYKSGETLKVLAGPGTGKTATLRMVAKGLKERTNQSRILYVAYSRSLAREAEPKFAGYAETRTLHSLALHCLGSRTHIKKRELGQISTRDAIEILDLSSSSNARARRAIQTMGAFVDSADAEVGIRHTPVWVRRKNPAAAETAVADAQGLFDALRPDKDGVPYALPHNLYLKTWALLGAPGIEAYDILYDEAQDANPVILSALRRARHVIYVGDEHQQIFAWRGAVNAMTEISGEEHWLTLSFRFGPAIAEAANRILDAKQTQSSYRLRGYEAVKSSIGAIDVNRPHTRLYRTNQTLLEDLVFLEDIGRKPAIAGGPGQILPALEGVWMLHEEQPRVRHPALRYYSSWDDLMEAIETGGGVDRKIKQAVGMVETFSDRVPQIIDRLRHARKESDGLALVSTIHMSKGREWDQVLIASDFDERFDDDENWEPSTELLNLGYVAVTRAAQRLSIQSEVLDEIISG